MIFWVASKSNGSQVGLLLTVGELWYHVGSNLLGRMRPVHWRWHLKAQDVASRMHFDNCWFEFPYHTSLNASSKRIVPEWFWRNSLAAWTLQSGRLETSGPTIFRTRLSETRNCQDHVLTKLGDSLQAAGIQKGWSANVCYSASQIKCSTICFCPVVLW